MFRKKQVSFFAITVMVGFCLSLPIKAETLRVGFFDLKPHIQTAKQANKEVTGPAIVYLRLIADKMGVTLDIQKEALPLDRLLQNLRDGQLDVAVALGKNPERERYLDYPEQPFYWMHSSLMVLKSSPLQQIKTAEELKPLKIGVYSNGYLSPLLRNPQLKTYKLYGSNLIYRSYQMLELHRFDAMYSPDQFDFKGEAIAYHFLDSIRILRLPEPPIGLYTAFSKKTDPDLIKRYEQSLRQMPPYAAYLDPGTP